MDLFPWCRRRRPTHSPPRNNRGRNTIAIILRSERAPATTMREVASRIQRKATNIMLHQIERSGITLPSRVQCTRVHDARSGTCVVLPRECVTHRSCSSIRLRAARWLCNTNLSVPPVRRIVFYYILRISSADARPTKRRARVDKRVCDEYKSAPRCRAVS